MTSSEFLSRRNSRTHHYGARSLDPKRWVTLQLQPAYAHTLPSQAAFLTAANLIGRMTPSLAIDIPSDIQVHAALPWVGSSLEEVVSKQLFAATPEEYGGRFTSRAPRPGDCVFSFGPAAVDGAAVVHGCGWNAYFGNGESPLAPFNSLNPFGAAFAAIQAGTHLMVGGLGLPPSDYLCNVLDWSERQSLPSAAPDPDPHSHLGRIWTIGTGSVGTAILYFLTMFTRNFDATLIDNDCIEIENLDRSPIFVADDDRKPKARATADYLRDVGVSRVQVEECFLSRSTIWRNRQEGVPDLIVASANEDHVRSSIEVGMPPVQVYGTTGKNWQASAIRHIPNLDPCSLCLFPDDDSPPAACATGKVTRASDGKSVDAALPFLSFAAGLMAASEILKLDLAGFPFSAASTQFAPRSATRLVSMPLQPRSHCLCQIGRNPSLHARMIVNTKHADLSFPA